MSHPKPYRSYRRADGYLRADGYARPCQSTQTPSFKSQLQAIRARLGSTAILWALCADMGNSKRTFETWLSGRHQPRPQVQAAVLKRLNANGKMGSPQRREDAKKGD